MAVTGQIQLGPLSTQCVCPCLSGYLSTVDTEHAANQSDRGTLRHCLLNIQRALATSQMGPTGALSYVHTEGTGNQPAREGTGHRGHRQNSQDGQLSRVLASRSGRSVNLKVVGSSPDLTLFKPWLSQTNNLKIDICRSLAWQSAIMSG